MIKRICKDWTIEEINILEKKYPMFSQDNLLKLLPNRIWSTITKKASELKIKRCVFIGHTPNSGSFKKGQRTSIKTEFKKGQKCWNKGTKGVMKANKTSWKKGHIPWIKGKKHLAVTGNKNPRWKGGITPLIQRIRHCTKYKNWVKEVFERDNWICQKYNTRGGELCSHHIKSFANNPKIRFKTSNGITLSKKAHIKFHNKYGWKNNTREQLKEFLGKRLDSILTI